MAKGKQAAKKKTAKKSTRQEAVWVKTASGEERLVPKPAAAAAAKHLPIGFLTKLNGDVFFCNAKRAGKHIAVPKCKRVPQGSAVVDGKLVPPPGPKAGKCTPQPDGNVIISVADIKFDCKPEAGPRGSVTLPCKRVRVARPAKAPEAAEWVLAPGQHATIKINGSVFDVHSERKDGVWKLRTRPVAASAGFAGFGDDWGLGRSRYQRRWR